MPEGPSPSPDSAEIATSTLAEIYAQQGLYERALSIYRRIQRASPDDAGIRQRIVALEEQLGASEPAAPESVAPESVAPEPAAEEQRERLPWEKPPDEVDAAAPAAESIPVPPDVGEPAGAATPEPHRTESRAPVRARPAYAPMSENEFTTWLARR